MAEGLQQETLKNVIEEKTNANVRSDKLTWLIFPSLDGWRKSRKG